MKVLIVGDVVGQTGCEHLRRRLPALKAQYGADLAVVNGENAAEGNGILPATAQAIFSCGADVITTGNHGLRRREINELMDQQIGLIRPANYHPTAHGAGVYVIDKLSYRIAVIDLQGVVYLDPIRNPFDCIDELLDGLDARVVIVDLHAEATSEKLAMAHYLDGRVSLLFGTHTHVQTADERVFPGGMGYITDVGMCGPIDSVLGVKPELAIRRLRTQLPTRFENAPGPCMLCGLVADIDERTGRCRSVERIQDR